ncbi:MAG: choice-of-anchor J domain-containing protein [Tenuifilaceae bacterium]|jgi:PKD repeat protein|nr:choice-of-anchor J domain-containing protein [Tenuifilaceae bacterium]
MKTIIIFNLLLAFSFYSTIGQNRSDAPPSTVGCEIDLINVETFLQANIHGSFGEQKSIESNYPLRVGYSHKVGIDTKSMGTIVNWDNGEKSWIIRIAAEDAPSVALVFEKVRIPADGRLYVYAEAEPASFYLINHNSINDGYASTPPLASSVVIVEYVESVLNRQQGFRGSFSISSIYSIYKGIDDMFDSKALGDSEVCQVNINCSPEGDAWQNQKRGVAKILYSEGGYLYACSGTLINNTSQDGKPYFLTAYHCGGNLSDTDRSTWQFFFNYERSGCENSTSPPTNLITGASLRSSGLLAGGSDFQLVELSQKPTAAWRPFYNGWDRAETVTDGGVSIHHPSGDVKKISTYTGSLSSATPNIDGSVMATNSTWRVTWTQTANGHGVTEGGSSGSPIFNSAGLVVGTLSGGSSSCSSPTSPDYYGKLNYHWSSNGTTNIKKLQPWLDPSNSNVSTLSGYDPSGDLYANFKADITVAQTNEEITFTDLSTGADITSWSWTFGEGATPATITGKGPHMVTYTTGGLKTVSLTINGTSTTTKKDYIRIQDIPSNTVLFEGFEGNTFPPTDWLNIDKDGDNLKWFSYIAEGAAHTGDKCAGSASWDDNKALRPDNWLITPPIEITHDNFILDYYVGAQDPDWVAEKYGIFISNKTANPSDFVEVFSEVLQGASWVNRQVDLSNFLGDIIYIAFRHYDCTDMFYIKIDDVLIAGGGEEPSHQARIHTFGFEEEGVFSISIDALTDNAAEIRVQVKDFVDITSLTPEFTISAGATIGYTPETAMDFTEPVAFTVTSESGQTVNVYTVVVTYAPKYPVTFNVFDSSQNPIEQASIIVVGYEEPIITDNEGKANAQLHIGDYTFGVTAEDFNNYSGSFSNTDQGITVNVNMIRTSSEINQLDKPKTHPNPFSTTITIRNAEKFNFVKVINILGEVKYSTRNYGDSEVIIPARDLKPGIYFVVLESQDLGRVVIKSVKH